MNQVGELVVGLVVLVGLVGIVVPVLPGSLLVWAAVLAWSLEEQSRTGWVVLVVASLAIGAAQVAKWAVAHRRLRRAGVPQRSLVYGGLLALVGFFLVPVVGLVLGFLVGVYLAERRRLRDPTRARAAAFTALRLAGLALLVELLGGLTAALTWAGGALAT